LKRVIARLGARRRAGGRARSDGTLDSLRVGVFSV
jgi:hypothetical protein